MRVNARSWLVGLGIAVVLGVSSCTNIEQEVRQVVTRYLDYEVAGDYRHQLQLYDLQSIAALSPATNLSNPFDPKQLVDYTINEVVVEGATAHAQVEAIFAMMLPGAVSFPEEHYNLTIYLLHQQDGWKVDEVATRVRALNTVVAPGAGDNWLAMRKQRLGQ